MDLFGFGRSDKPRRLEDHSFARHVEWVRSLVLDHLRLDGITLVGQDWGGLIGLRLVAEHPDRFARVVAANTGLPATSGCRRCGGSSAGRWSPRRCSTSPGSLPPGACRSSTPRRARRTTPRSPTRRRRWVRG
ncbi:alpha/beta fold hydrolase [Nocardioides caldifontis]|uniref:alpha/beta fold hydrolase n=1 Tax=Nocardioides caldifontis TaxID=2588938 RepID=UPI003B8451D0